MKAEKKEEVKIVLELSETEARWLTVLFQNPLRHCTVSEEVPENSTNRKEMFDILRTSLNSE